MDLISIIVIAALLGLLYTLAARHANRKEQWERKEQRPRILQQSRLVLSERGIACRKPVPLHGRVDQVYETPDGWWIIVDTKKRIKPRVYPYDIIQGSVYRVILKSQGRKVSGRGYVRQVGQSGAVRYLPYNMLKEKEVIGLWKRRWIIQENPSQARKAVSPKLCRSCGQREIGRCNGYN